MTIHLVRCDRFVRLSFGPGYPVVEFVEQIVDLEQEMKSNWIAAGGCGRINVGAATRLEDRL